MKYDKNDENDPRVRDADGWYDEEEFDHLPDNVGIFAFVDDKEDVKYIGICRVPNMMRAAYDAFEAGKAKGATKMGYMMTFSVDKAESFHKDMVAKYKPANN